MTAIAVADRSQVRRFVERILPWYDVDHAARLHERTVAIGRASALARSDAARTRRAPLAARLHRANDLYRERLDGNRTPGG